MLAPGGRGIATALLGLRLRCGGRALRALALHQRAPSASGRLAALFHACD